MNATVPIWPGSTAATFTVPPRIAGQLLPHISFPDIDPRWRLPEGVNELLGALLGTLPAARRS